MRFTSFPSLKSYLFTPSVVRVFMIWLLDLSICSDSYTGVAWYNKSETFCALVRFLYFGTKPLTVLSVGQKTVKPLPTFSLKDGTALEGVAVGASASAELMAALIWRTEM
ncbi:hypothetical protein AAZV13_13G278700 [Glycine max]